MIKNAQLKTPPKESTHPKEIVYRSFWRDIFWRLWAHLI